MTVFVEKIEGKNAETPALAMLHGWGLNGAVWQSVAETLAETFTLYLVDLPGHGASDSAGATTLEAMADAVASALPASINLLGWSLGGQVALTLARRRPAQVARLILVATTPRFVAHDDWPHGMKHDVLADFAARLTNDYAGTIKRFLALQALNQDNIRETILLMQRAVLARGKPNLESLQHGLNILATSDLRDQLHLITQPTLVIQGDHDALTPESAGHWLAAHLPNAKSTQYEMIAHAAHAPFLSHRRQFFDAIKQFMSP